MTSGALPNRLLLRVIRLVRLPILRGICMETPWPVPVLELLLVVLKDWLTRMPPRLAPTLEVGHEVRPRQAIMATLVMLALLASLLVNGSKVAVLAIMRLAVRGFRVLPFFFLRVWEPVDPYRACAWQLPLLRKLIESCLYPFRELGSCVS